MRFDMHSEAGIDVLIIDGEGCGGMAHYARNLADGLARHCRAQLHTIGPDEGLENPNSIEKLLEHTRVGRKWRRQYSARRYRASAINLIRRYQPRLVHIASRIASMRGLVTELNRQGIPVVATIHDPVPHREHRTLWGHVYTQFSNRWRIPGIFAGCDALHVHSDLHARQLATIYSQLSTKNIYVVQHGGGATDSILAGTRVPDEIGNIKHAALFFGRIEPYKGVDVLLAATEQIIKEIPDFQIIVAGAGKLPTIAPHLLAHIRLVNRFIDDEEIRALFEASSFVVLPYREATQSGVIPLASAFSVPAITSNVGALSELVTHGKTGLVIPPSDSHALADAILELLRSPEKTVAMGRAAFEHMEKNFAWPMVGKSHLTHYATLSPAIAVQPS